MPKGNNLYPVVDVFVGQIAAIPFELFNYGQPWDLTGATTIEISITFNDGIKYQGTLVIVDPITGTVLLPAGDIFDEPGDWDGIIRIQQDSETFFTEEFIFNVKQPGGF